jgi:hypothetical protein
MTIAIIDAVTAHGQSQPFEDAHEECMQVGQA